MYRKNFIKILLNLSLITLLLTISITRLSAKEMYIVYANGYAPYSWQEKGEVKGIDRDLLDELLGKKMGISLKHGGFPWARAQRMVEEGQADAFLTIPTSERRVYTEVTELPLFKANFVMFTGATNPKIEKLRNIKNLDELKKIDDLRHVHILGGGWHSVHLKGIKQLSKSSTSPQLLKMLTMNMADVYIEQSTLAQYQIKEAKFESKIIEIPTVMGETKWHLHIGKKSFFVHLMPRLNKMLKEMERDGSLEKIRKKIFENYQ